MADRVYASNEQADRAALWPRDYAEPQREYVPPLTDEEIKAIRELVDTAKFRTRIWKRLIAVVAFLFTIIPSIFMLWEKLR